VKKAREKPARELLNYTVEIGWVVMLLLTIMGMLWAAAAVIVGLAVIAAAAFIWIVAVAARAFGGEGGD
jgi:cobalamin synthase